MRSTSAEDFNLIVTILEEIVKVTGQEKQVCHFYLEMVDWDYEKAMDMFSNLAS